MLFQNKASIHYVLTLYSVEHNKQHKVIKFDTKRLVMRCIHKACPWSIRATCSKKNRMWVISKCNGPHSCTSLQVATSGRMMDSKFISIALEKYVRARIYGDFDELYAKLPQFLATLSDADPNTITMLKCDLRVPGTCIFNSTFWAFGLCIKGFKHYRPVISINGW